MSITDELREWAEDSTLQDRVLTTYPPQHAVHGVLETLLRIADRIDAEHERVVMSAMNDALYHANDESMAELGWVRLPKDADGVPIRVGDVMDSRVDYLFDGKPFTVRALVLCEDGWEVADGRFGNRYELDSLRHHHAPTVEDVLREFVDEMNQNLGMYTGEAIDADEWRSADNKTIAEFAAKLRRLAGDAS